MALSCLTVLLAAGATVGCRSRIEQEVPTTRGRWAAYLNEVFFACAERKEGWSYARATQAEVGDVPAGGPGSGDTRLSYVTSDGLTRQSWLIPGRITLLTATYDCEVVWVEGRDGQLFTIDRRTDATPVQLQTKLPSEAIRISPAEDGVTAWVQLRGRHPFVLLRRSGPTLTHSVPPGIQKALPEHDYQASFQGAGIWVVPSGKGLWYVTSSGTRAVAMKPIPELDLDGVYAGLQGRVAWLQPVSAPGLYAVDVAGRVLTLDGSTDLLPGRMVRSIITGVNTTFTPLTFAYTWVTTTDHDLYGFESEEQTDGTIVIRRLNGGRPIARRAGGAPLKVARVSWIKDGGELWLGEHVAGTPEHWSHVWRLSVGHDRSVSVRPLDPRHYDGKRLQTFFADYKMDDALFLRTRDFVLYRYRHSDESSVREPFQGRQMSSLSVTDRSDSLWATTEAGTFLVRETTPDIALGIAGAALTALGARSTMSEQPSSASVSIRLPNKLRLRGGRVAVSILETSADADQSWTARRLRTVSYGEADLNEDGSAMVNLYSRVSLRPNQRYDVELGLSDRELSQMTLRWAALQYWPPLHQHPIVKAIALIVAPVAALLALLPAGRGLRTWVPVGVPVAELGIVGGTPRAWDASPTDLAIAGVIVMGLTAAVAAVSPRALRTVAELQPYRTFVPVVIRMKHVRRRLWRAYAEECRQALRRIRSEANDEIFVEGSLTCNQRSPGIGLGPSTTVTEIWQILTRKGDGGGNVLVQATGGRGKSAILNELFARSLAGFERNALAPLPVLVPSASGGSLPERVDRALGRHSLGLDLTTALLTGGDLLVLMDGVTEGGFDPEPLASYVSDPESIGGSRVCATARPSAAWREAFQKSDAWAIVEPDRLSRAHLTTFIRAYGTDADHKWEESEAVDRALVVAKAPDGTYLPLLVRLALLSRGSEVGSIADLYRAVVERLLTKGIGTSTEHVTMLMAERIACDTYWGAAQRVFSLERPTPDDTRACEQMLEAGVLSSADMSASRLSRRPHAVRFFHDSVQSFLAASQLARQDDLDVLRRAALDERLSRSLTEWHGTSAPELFVMCLETFTPGERTVEWLVESLDELAEASSGLSLDDVLESLPQYARESVIAEGGYREQSVASLLRDLTRTNRASRDSVVVLGSMYWRLLRKSEERRMVREELMG